MTVEYAARSHMGRVRGNNEDNLYVGGVILTPDIRERPFMIDGVASLPAVFAVCDGMGGEDYGEVASLSAVRALADESGSLLSASPQRLDEAVQFYINKANESIHAIEDSDTRAGTTLALAIAAVSGIYCFNMGDSRIYSLQKTTGFIQITNDHTLTADGLKTGNKLTRCIGIGNILTAESYPPLFGDCRLLICSDGLTDMVSETELERVLRLSVRAAAAADLLLDSALRNGGKDNITLIVIDVKKSKKSFFRSIAKKMRGQERA